jgi:hypothetical protein
VVVPNWPADYPAVNISSREKRRQPPRQSLHSLSPSCNFEIGGPCHRTPRLADHESGKLRIKGLSYLRKRNGCHHHQVNHAPRVLHDRVRGELQSDRQRCWSVASWRDATRRWEHLSAPGCRWQPSRTRLARYCWRVALQRAVPQTALNTSRDQALQFRLLNFAAYSPEIPNATEDPVLRAVDGPTEGTVPVQNGGSWQARKEFWLPNVTKTAATMRRRLARLILAGERPPVWWPWGRW